MLTFRQQMDRHSLDLYRDEKRIGYLQWHPEHPPHIMLSGDSPLQEISLSEVSQCLRKYKEVTGREVPLGF